MSKVNRLIKLTELVSSFNELYEMYLNDFSNDNIDLDKLIFNTGYKCFELYKEILKIKKES